MDRRQLLRTFGASGLVLTIGRYLGPLTPDEAEAANKKKTRFFTGAIKLRNTSGLAGLGGGLIVVGTTGQNALGSMVGRPEDGRRIVRFRGRLRGQALDTPVLDGPGDAEVPVGRLQARLRGSSLKGRFSVDDFQHTFTATERPANARLMRRMAGRYEVGFRNSAGLLIYTGLLLLAAAGTFRITEIQQVGPGAAPPEQITGRFQLGLMNGKVLALVLISLGCFGFNAFFGTQVGPRFTRNEASLSFMLACFLLSVLDDEELPE